MLLLAPLLLGAARADYKTLLTRYSADPAPLVVGDRLFIHATHDDAAPSSPSDYTVFSTADGANWRDDGIAFSPVHNTTWATGAGAQQTIWHEGLNRFLLYFSGAAPGSRQNVVGVASATDPRGPFADYAGEAFAQGEDPTVFVEGGPGGRGYICTVYGQPDGNVPWCAPLNADMKSLARNQSRVVIEGLPPRQFFGAPSLFKLNSTYYLSFETAHDCPCGGPFGYGIGYATNTGADPLGNYTYRGPLMWPNPANCASQVCANTAQPSPGGNAHAGIALDWPQGSGQHWVAYHTRRLAAEKGAAGRGLPRNVALDRMYFGKDGEILPVTSTPDWVRQQAFVDPYAIQPAAAMATANDANGSSVFLTTEPGRVDPAGGQWRVLTNITANDTIRIKGLNLGIFESTSDAWSTRALTARLSCTKPAVVEVAVAAGTGTKSWPGIWPPPGQPPLSDVLTEVPHARINVTAGSFTNVTAPLVPGTKGWGVSHQVGACGGPEGCPPSSIDLVLTFRAPTYVRPKPVKPKQYYTCFGLGIPDCTKPGESDCCSTQNITGNMTLCFCMKTFEHACDPRYPPVKPSAGGHGCFDTPMCGGMCPKGATDLWSAAGRELMRQQEAAEAAADAEAEGFECSMSSWGFSTDAPPPPIPVVPPKPDPVATAIALKSRATGKYVAAMTANRQGVGEVTASWCHISIEAVVTLSDNEDGSYNLHQVGNDGVLAHCGGGGGGPDDNCDTDTESGVGVGNAGSPSAPWRILGTPDGGYAFMAADASPAWPATGLLLAPTGQQQTTYDGQLLWSGGMGALTAPNGSNVSAGCAAVLESKCLPWRGVDTYTCAKHCSTHPNSAEPRGTGGATAAWGCHVKPGFPKDYEKVCESKLSARACAVLNATCDWHAPPPLPPAPPGCTASEVEGWCAGSQPAVFDVCKITVVGQTVIDCGGCHPCCGTNGRPGDCSRDPDCELGP